MPIAIQSLMLALVAACDVLIILDYDFWIDFSCKTSPADNRDKLRRREWERIRVIRRMSYLTIIVMGLILLMSGILCPLGICGVFMEVGVDGSACAMRDTHLFYGVPADGQDGGAGSKHSVFDGDRPEKVAD